MNYIDGYVVAVPSKNKNAYIENAKEFSQVFKDYGALQVVECWGDDVPEGTLTSFPMAVKCQPDETVVFAWISWASKAARDEGMAKSMADPRMKHDSVSMPFDGKRMIFGGFQAVVQE